MPSQENLWTPAQKLCRGDEREFVTLTFAIKYYTKSGCLRPLVIPTYSEIDDDIILGLMRTAGMTSKKYFEYLEACK